MTATEIEYVEEIKALKEKVAELQEIDDGYISLTVAEAAFDKLLKEIKGLDAANKRLKEKVADLHVILTNEVYGD